MSGKVEIAIITRTQEALGKYVKKPPLTEKLLKKPPFRYLHDIVSTVIRETGFLDGVFSIEEMDSSNIRNKEAKISFLNKLIVAVQTASRQEINVRPAKIVAGLEVNKTLELLQLIAKIIDEKVVTKKILEESSLKCNYKSQEKDKNTIMQKDVENNSIKSYESQAVIKETTQKSLTKSVLKCQEPNKNNIIKEVAEENLKKSNESKTNKNNNEKKSKKPEPNDSTNSPKNIAIKEQKRTVTRIKEAPKGEQLGKISKEIATVVNDVKNVSSIGKNKAPVIKHLVGKKNVPSKSTVPHKSSFRENSESNSALIKNSESVADKKIVLSQSTKTVTERKNCSIVDNENTQKSKFSLSTSEDPTKISEATKSVADKQELTMKNSKHIESGLRNLEKLTQKQESVIAQRPSSARPDSRKLHREEIKKNNSSDSAGSIGRCEKSAMLLKNKTSASIRPGTPNRPPSARPGAPRIRDRGEVSLIESLDITESSVHVIEESGPDQIIDDKDSFIVVESESISTAVMLNESEEMNDTEQGQLVHQILRTQKELHGDLNADSTSKKHLGIERETNRKVGGDFALKKIEKIRESLQTLTSAANPLGKLFDFLQEDVNEMLRELQHWKYINDKLHKQQITELGENEKLLQPLLKQLSDVENNIREEYLQIESIKTIILNKDRKILKLTCSVLEIQRK